VASSRSADLTGMLYLFRLSFAGFHYAHLWKAAALPAEGMLVSGISLIF